MSITNHLKSILAGFGMLLLAFNVSAYPALMFDGPMTYAAESGLVDVQGELTGSQDISPLLQLSGSTFQFRGLLDTSSTDAVDTLGRFTGITGVGSSPLLSVIDGDSSHTTLLKGELSGLAMLGINGSNGGVLKALFNPTGGSLLNEFAVGSKLFAFQLNLTTPFGSEMFTRDFKGHVDGRLIAPVSVPEPGVLVLFMLGLGVIVIVMRKKSKKPGQTFNRHIRWLN